MRLFALCLLCFQTLFGAQSYIGYSKSGGRFGDNLLTYLHAKWLSYKSDVPIFYEPFPYSSELAFSSQEFSTDDPSRLHLLPYRPGMHLEKSLPFIYLCPYFPAFEDEQNQGGWTHFSVDWKDPVFRALCLSLIAPKRPLALTLPPKDTLSIAMHVREGGGFDTDHTRLYDPLKLPPLTYYIEALAKVAALFPDRPLYCHIFTDAIDVQAIAKTIAQNAPSNVTIHYRTEENHHTKNVLEDFFSLFHYNILIRSRSNYSVIPALLHDYEVVCFPEEFSRIGRTIKITRIGIEQQK